MKIEGRTVAVLGAGTMGQGIAQIAAASGFGTRVFDAQAGRADAAKKGIASQLDKLVAKGRIAADAKDATLERLAPTASIADAAIGADLVIEAVPESMELKIAVFGEAMAAAKPDALLASKRRPSPTRSSHPTRRRSRSPSSAPSWARPSARSVCTSSTRRR
jgi:3-hydroxybutyryl-CoA dehydrogenase